MLFTVNTLCPRSPETGDEPSTAPLTGATPLPAVPHLLAAQPSPRQTAQEGPGEGSTAREPQSTDSLSHALVTLPSARHGPGTKTMQGLAFRELTLSWGEMDDKQDRVQNVMMTEEK